ncbi:unnamed protein product [Rotaria socialis]|uniref:EF-hand domain-containing protein n=1 Tax=Rotaria socialis TaxID=392032 RepID=A0A821L8F2_9BILA|nr:unnamed protein product [Rotaria socialis]
MLNPIPISLEDMFYLDTLNSEDNEKFSATRDRLIHFIAEHHEKEQKLQADIIVRCSELRMLREAMKKQYLEAEENKQALELQIKQMTKEYEAARKAQEKRYQDMIFKLEVTKQQAAQEEKSHEFACVEAETLHKEKKTGLKGQCQQFWEKVEDERGVFKKVEKCCKIVRNELHVKHKSNEDDEQKNLEPQSSIIKNGQERNETLHGDQLNKIPKNHTKPCKKTPNSSLLRAAIIGGGLGAASVGALGAGAGAAAGAGAVAGGAAGIILGPCGIATAAAAAAGAAAGTTVGAAAGAAMGAAAGVTIGGIGSAIITLYRFRRKRYRRFGYEKPIFGLFQRFDNGNGILSLAEIDRAVIHWYPEFGTNRQAMIRAYKAADWDGSGFIELKEFQRLIDLLYYYNRLSDLFGQLDTNKDKRISFIEFKKGYKLVGQSNIPENHIREEFNRIDTNHGGYILFDEFCIYMAKKQLARNPSA